MMTKKARIVRTAAVVFAAAAIGVFAGALPASADFTQSPVITAPSSGYVLSGDLDSSNSFNVTARAEAKTSCPGFEFDTLKIVDYESAFDYSKTLTDSDSNGDAKIYNGSAVWSTASVRNGNYRVQFDIKERDCLLDAEKAFSGFINFKVANPTETPVWEGSPQAGANAEPPVTIQWKKNPELDIVQYQVQRKGPEGVSTALVSPDGCPESDGVYTCQDVQFGENYTGSYEYHILALRSAPTGTGVACSASATDRCVVSAASETKMVSLVAPTPTPMPTDPPATPPPGTPGAGTPSNKPKTGGASSGGGTRVLSFGDSGGFYSGTYSESLPYQPRTLILGGGSATSSPQSAGYQGEVVSETAPDYRTIMLPVAGGLLAFLSAAHVRRLLLHL